MASFSFMIRKQVYTAPFLLTFHPSVILKQEI